MRGIGRIGMATAALALVLGGCSDSSGPDDVVTIEMRAGNVFSPATRTVTAGTRVRWVNEDAVLHNTVSATAGLWTSANLQQGQTFERTFATVGTFAYVCTLHAGMAGTIVVE